MTYTYIYKRLQYLNNAFMEKMYKHMTSTIFVQLVNYTNINSELWLDLFCLS
jgi:hypothetical protein